MNLDSLSIALSQISYLVATLSKRNYSTCVQELSELISCHGLEADRHLLRCLFSEIDFNSDSVRTPNSKDFQQIQLLTQECSVLLGKPALVSVLCFAVDRALQQENFVKNPSQLLIVFSKIVKLSPVQEVVFGLALLHSSNKEIADSALQFVKQKLPSLIKSYIGEDKSAKLQEGGLHEATPQVIHFILTYLFSAKDLFGINFESKELLLNSLRRDFPRELVPVVLSPLLYPNLNFDLRIDKMTEEAAVMANSSIDDSLPNLIMEMGYGFCATLDEGRQNMNSLQIRDLTPTVVARVVIMMVRTHTGLDDLAYWASIDNNSEKSNNENCSTPTSWNVEVFVQLIKEFSPNTMWVDIIRELDGGELLLKDRQGLILLMSTLKLGLQAQGCPADRFPVDLLYRPWKHPESQFTLINQILKNPDIFCFADYSYHPVAVEILKTTPETDNKEIATWRSLNLVDLLMHLADRGLITQVQELLKHPIQHCPDFLSLAVLQTSHPMTLFKQEVLSTLIPVFLANHANSTVILHHMWHNQNMTIKQLLIQCMADWYIRGECDQTRLSRILDIAHDLKALSLLLNSQSLQFAIDLACLASRREYLKLEKWLSDKIRDQGEMFVSALIKFLQRRCSQFLGGSFAKEETHPKAAQLPQETIATILACLQACANNVSPEIAEGILTLLSNCNLFLKSRQAPPGVLRTTSFNPNQIFSNATNAQVDSLTNLGTSLSNLNLAAPQTSNSFSLPAALGPLVSAPGSPSRLISLSQNTSFPLLPQLSGTIGSQVNHGPSTSVGNSIVAVNNLNRVIAHSQANPIEKSRLVNAGDGAIPANPSDLTLQVSKEIEDEANSYFQRIYNHPPHPTLSIDEILDLLKKFQESPIKREREIYSCMIRNLFEEYKFFPQYPDKELHVTAQLFGGILSHGLVPQGALFGIGIRYIVDALRKPSNSKIFAFGIAALDQFKYKLKEVPKLCEYVMSLPNFSEFPPYLIELIEYGAQGIDPPSKTQTIASNVVSILNNSGGTAVSFKTVTSITSSGSTNASPVAKLGTPTRPSIANATNIDTLLVATEKDEKMVVPPENLQDKIAFTFNNLSQMNLAVKCEELRELIREEHYQWLAQYLVMKRASIEQNFHGLYSNFLDCLKIKEFYKLILAESYRNIRVLLRSDKSIANLSDRTLLKNLGHWLGMMTLAKNKPVLMDDLDIKLLLHESHQKGHHEMLYIVPFVAKILESCAKSRVFRPPNPWTMSVIYILAEIHHEPDLKLNLKFEIEVLCKNLQIDMRSLKETKYLRDTEVLKYTEPQLSNVIKKPSSQQQPQQHQQQQHQQQQHQQQQHQQQQHQQQQHQQQQQQPQQQQHQHQQHQHQHQHQQQNSSPLPVPAPITQPPISSSAISNISAEFTSIVSTPSSSMSFSNTPMTSVSEEMIPHQLGVGMPPLTSSVQTPPLLSQPVITPEPKYNLVTFNVTNIQSLAPMLSVNAQLPLFQAHPQLKSCVKLAFERAIQEWLGPIVDRSVKIAVNTSEQIVKKDFALDPDESRVRAAAHYMVRNLAAGMAMITCREQIINSFTQNLKSTFLAMIMNPNVQQKEMIEQAVTACVNENMDLACAFVQKTTVDKAVIEIDRHLFSEYERRKNARNEGRRYCDSGVLTYQAERMPEQVRLKVGGVTPQQMAVYEEFARNIPGFQPMSDKEAAMCTPKTTPFAGTSDEMGVVYDKITSDLELYLQTMMNQNVMSASLSNCQMNMNISSLIDSLSIHRRTRDLPTAAAVIQKAVEGLLDCMNQDDPDLSIRYRDFYLRILKVFQDSRSMGIQWTNKQVTKALLESREEYRYNTEVVDLLIRSHLLNLPMFDSHLASAMENGMNYVAVAFCIQIVQHYLVEERNPSLVTEQDLCHCIETLIRIVSHSRNPPEGLVALIDILRMNHDSSSNLSERTPVGATAYIHSGILQVKAREFDDPPGLFEKTEYLLREWVNIYQTTSTNKDPSKAFSLFVHQMNVHGILKTDDLITRFFRLSTQMVVDLCYRLLPDPAAFSNNRMKVFQTLDAFVKLIALLVKHSGDSANVTTKLNLLNKVLGIVAGVLLQDHENHQLEFHQLPYHRIFSMLFLELNSADQVLESINFHILQAFSHTLHILRPCKCPGFCFAWLEIISHRVFLGRVLAHTQHQKGWATYAQLLVDLFKYLAPFLRNTNLTKAVTTMYKGALKVLLVLLHDFPEFLCEYHYGFCDVIPPNCIQMRNLILSAFPRNMRLPDPFTPNLKVDMLAEITQAPRILPTYAALIQPASFKKDLDNYLKTRAPITFLSEIRSNLQVLSEPGIRYNIPLLNAVVLYVGAQAINHIRSKGQSPNMSTIAHSAHMDIFQNLSSELDTEGRYLFLNAIANQLRYPNSHTHYFSCTLLYLFAEASSECVQEQITRVLLERIIVNRPHPWGLLITFIELIKNPIYRFWSHEFVHCAAEIEKLLESVARSCMVPPHLIHGSAPDSD